MTAPRRATPRTGTAGYRPMPADFEAQFVRHGWGAIGEVLHAHRRSIKQWLLIAGEDRLKRLRRAYLEKVYAQSQQRVPGRRHCITADAVGSNHQPDGRS